MAGEVTMPALICWECKTCGWEHWASRESDPPSTCPDPKCRKKNPTWIGHHSGSRSSCEFAPIPDKLAALEPNDPVDALAGDGRWYACRFLRWEADGLCAAIEGTGPGGQRMRSVGRNCIRPRVVDA